MSPEKPPVVRLAIGRTTRLSPLRRSTGGEAPRQPTLVELHDDGERLSVRFDCVDARPWATLTARDADLWTEEVVELFIAPGAATPSRYFEIEVNPLGALFDARIGNRGGDRSALEVDRDWDCAGLEAAARLSERGWRATIGVPWRSLSNGSAIPRRWRLNLFRIDRPDGAAAEHSAWSPTFVDPADFHRPARFGILERLG